MLLGGLGSATPTSADEVQLHFVASGSAGATDNIFSAPDGGMTSRDADVTYTLTPGVIGSFGTPRTTHEFALNASFNGYLDHREAWGLQVFGDYRAAIALTPLADLSLSAGLSRGVTTALIHQTAPSDGAATPTPAGEVNQQGAHVDEALAYSLSSDTRLQQHASASYTQVTDASDAEVGTLQLNVGVGGDHGFQVSSAGVDVGVSFLAFDRPPSMAMSAEPDRRADARLGLRWRRDVSQRWSIGADAGVVTVIPIDGDAGLTPVPVISANATYVPEWGTASVQVGRAVTANPFIAQQTVGESAAVNVNLPLPWLNRDRASDDPEWTASGSLAGARSRILNTDTGALDGELVNGLIDLGVAFVPREEMTFALRFQYTRQETLEGIPGMDGSTDLPSLSRSTLLFTFTYRYPGRIVSRLPPRRLLRVDEESTPLQERRGERGR